MRISRFPYGCQYHRHPTPLPEEWEGDFAELTRLHYTHVQFRPQWRCHERIKGEYDWQQLDALFDLVEKFPLAVVLKPQLENAPDWVFTELGGTRIGFDGMPLGPIAHAAFYVGGWWPCFTNPAVAEAAETFTRKMAERYRTRRSLWLYNAWNEPRSRPLGQCHCPHCLASYQEWLRRRFNSVEELNARYGKAWTSFETIRPPRSHSDYLELFLWRQWAAEQVAHQVEISAKGLKAGDPDHVVMCHVGCSSLIQDPACDTSNDLLNARHVDIYGCSFPVERYPKTLLEVNQPLYQSSWLRRVDPNYFCHEFYTNGANWCVEPDPLKLERQIWMAIASGAQALTFWQYRSERVGEESNGWGMREIDGSANERSECCDRIGAALERFGQDFAQSRFESQRVAVWFDPANDLLMRIEDMGADLNGIRGIGSIGIDMSYTGKRAVEASYGILRKMGVTADFVVPGDDLSAYSLLVIPAAELITQKSATQLEAYVEKGGTLLIEYPFACRDERTWVEPKRPAHGLEKLTGCREMNRQVVDKSQAVVFGDGVCQQAAGWKVKLSPLSEVAVIGRWDDGTAAVVEHAFGKGKVIVSGANFALYFWNSPNDMPIPEPYRRGFALANVQIAQEEGWRVRRVSSQRAYTFIFNEKSLPMKTILPESAVMLYLSPGGRIDGQQVELPPDGTAIIAEKQVNNRESN